MWVFDEEVGMNQREVTYVPGLYKIFDEILGEWTRFGGGAYCGSWEVASTFSCFQPQRSEEAFFLEVSLSSSFFLRFFNSQRSRQQTKRQEHVGHQDHHRPVSNAAKLLPLA